MLIYRNNIYNKGYATNYDKLLRCMRDIKSYTTDYQDKKR